MAFVAVMLQGCSGSPGPDPEPPPAPTPVQISIAGAAVDEGNAAGVTLIFPVTLSAAASSDVTVSYATSDGNATSASDYGATSGLLRIAAGSTNAQISVPVTGDLRSEADETFLVMLSNPSSNAAISIAAATGTIRNDDAGGPPSAAGSALNDTGVTLCSNGVNNLVACSDPATGTDEYPRQDAESGRDLTANDLADGQAGFSFTKLDATGMPLADQSVGYSSTPWDCVQDNVTGLVWETKTDDDGLQDRDSTYSWYNSTGIGDGGDRGEPGRGVCSGQTCDTESYAAQINDAALCNRSDWRLPTRSEALSLVHYGAASAPLLDTAFIANESPVTYWTSDSFQRDGWAMDAQARVRSVVKGGALAVRLVSGRELP